MKTTVSFDTFCDSFSESRKDTFSYDGKKALFDYLEQWEEAIGEEIELDTVALCCEYTEYSSLAELQKDYSDVESFDDLVYNTTVIYTKGYSDIDAPFIIQNY